MLNPNNPNAGLSLILPMLLELSANSKALE
jgi:hypothetical protein